jgi:hypothetical protein
VREIEALCEIVTDIAAIAPLATAVEFCPETTQA